MKIFRSKGYACKKHFSNDNLTSRPYPSTTSLGEPRRVSLADWTTLFTHPYKRDKHEASEESMEQSKWDRASKECQCPWPPPPTLSLMNSAPSPCPLNPVLLDIAARLPISQQGHIPPPFPSPAWRSFPLLRCKHACVSPPTGVSPGALREKKMRNTRRTEASRVRSAAGSAVWGSCAGDQRWPIGPSPLPITLELSR